MAAPRWLARFNLYVTNRVLGPVASRMPGMGVVVHTGRRSHRQYRTPVLVFPRGGLLIIALTYGRQAQWVQNVLAAGGCELETQRRVLQLSEPRLFRKQRRREMPGFSTLPFLVRQVSEFLELRVSTLARAA